MEAFVAWGDIFYVQRGLVSLQSRSIAVEIWTRRIPNFIVVFIRRGLWMRLDNFQASCLTNC